MRRVCATSVAPRMRQTIALGMRRKIWSELHRVCAGGFGANCTVYAQEVLERIALGMCRTFGELYQYAQKFVARGMRQIF